MSRTPVTLSAQRLQRLGRMDTFLLVKKLEENWNNFLKKHSRE
jgi:hypothetical protein